MQVVGRRSTGLERWSCEGDLSGLSVVSPTTTMGWLTTGSLVTEFDISFFLFLYLFILFG